MGDYHVMDDNLNDDEEEMLDDEEIKKRNDHMLKDLQEKIE